MPIINELKSLNRLEAAGFTPAQAKAIVEVAEEGHQDGFARFVEVLDQRLGELDSRARADTQSVRLDMQTMRSDLLKDQRDQMLRFAALVSLIVTVIGGIVGAMLKWL
jgi:hypothetical protein